MDKNKLSLLVRDASQVIFEGEVKTISSINEKGKFDVLPQHANFISLVSQTLVARMTEGGERQFQVDNGVLRVLSNKIEVYLGIKTT